MSSLSVKKVRLYFLEIDTRVPLKFGAETLTHATCARVSVEAEVDGRLSACGWGETPLSVQWVWPSSLGFDERETALKDFCLVLAGAIDSLELTGHPLHIGAEIQERLLPNLLEDFNAPRQSPMPYLAALVCLASFDIAIHDAYAAALGVPVYSIYGGDHLEHDLSNFVAAADKGPDFSGLYPGDFFALPSSTKIPAWHLVGGKDLLSAKELDGSEPEDGYPVLLADWIQRDGLKCLKIKLTGTDPEWDHSRIVECGSIAVNHGVLWLTADFNCQVRDPDYVNAILDRLLMDEPRIYGMILYVEQPFPYDLESNPIDVHSVSARKPLFMDESAHDWRLVRLGKTLGWTGVALKTCKTQTGALLSLCWAKAHGMTLMVQDLTNPMLAQIPHLQLGYHAGTIMGVETNSMQFYPAVSEPEAKVHPGLYERREGSVDLSSVLGYPGFGYRIDEIDRTLPAPVFG